MDRTNTISPIGLSALVAVLHLAVLAGRLSRRVPPLSPVARLAWRSSPGGQAESVGQADARGSNPITSTWAGRLSLTAGMAVIGLAAWLHTMHTSGVVDR